MNKNIVKSLAVAALVAASLAQVAHAAPPAAGGGFQATEAFAIWMAAVRNLRNTLGFAG